MAAAKTATVQPFVIKAPSYKTVTIRIIGTAPYVFNKFGSEARNMMREKQAQGGTSKTSKAARAPKDFEALGEQSVHRDINEGWAGIPCTAFRSAIVRAGCTVGAKMTDLKQLVRVHGEPKHVEHCVRNDTGVADIRPRRMLDPGWTATLRITFDSDFIAPESLGNLLLRAGMSVGVGAGRAFSKDSVGMGWGSFTIVEGKPSKKGS